MIFSPTIESEFDNLDKENQDLKTTIKNATDEIEELINFTNKNIIIIFDELDRCGRIKLIVRFNKNLNER